MTAADPYRGARVLVTGGAGFIGSNLARRLTGAGARVMLVDSLIPEYGGNLFNILDLAERAPLNICDVRDPHAMRYLVREQDFLFNLAGQTSHLDSMSDPRTDLEINAAAQLSILEACRNARCACIEGLRTQPTCDARFGLGSCRIQQHVQSRAQLRDAEHRLVLQ